MRRVRVDLRVVAAENELWEEAARVLGVSKSELIRRGSNRLAQEVLGGSGAVLGSSSSGSVGGGSWQMVDGKLVRVV